jgi:hypothetical protein
MKFKILEKFEINPDYIHLIDDLNFEYSYTIGKDSTTLKITKQTTKVDECNVPRLLQIFEGTIAEYDDTETIITIRKHNLDPTLWRKP